MKFIIIFLTQTVAHINSELWQTKLVLKFPLVFDILKNIVRVSKLKQSVCLPWGLYPTFSSFVFCGILTRQSYFGALLMGNSGSAHKIE